MSKKTKKYSEYDKGNPLHLMHTSLPHKEHEDTNGYLDANIFSKFTWTFVTSILERGRTGKKLDVGDFHGLSHVDSTAKVFDDLESQWEREIRLAKFQNRKAIEHALAEQKEKQNMLFTSTDGEDPSDSCTVEVSLKQPSLVRALARTYGGELLTWGLLLIIYTVTKVVNVILLNRIIVFIRDTGLENPRVSDSDGLLYSFLLPAVSLFQMLLHHQFWYHIPRVSGHLRYGLTALLYSKVLGYDSSCYSKISKGNILNVISSDPFRFEDFGNMFNYIWNAPLEGSIILYLIYLEIGVSVIYGVLVLLGLVIIQFVFSHRFAKLRLLIVTSSDLRVKITSETVHGIEMIKMGNLEDVFFKSISKERDVELSHLKFNLLLRGINMGSFISATIMLSLATFVGHVLSGGALAVEQVFTVICYYDSITCPLVQFLPLAIEKTTECAISCGRMQRLLCLNDDITGLKDQYMRDLGDIQNINDAPVNEGVGGGVGRLFTRVARTGSMISGGMFGYSSAVDEDEDGDANDNGDSSGAGYTDDLQDHIDDLSPRSHVPNQGRHRLASMHSTFSSLSASAQQSLNNDAITGKLAAPGTICIDNISFYWPSVNTPLATYTQDNNPHDDEAVFNILKASFALPRVRLCIERGQLIVVTGGVGSGKSSLLMAILGEMPIAKRHEQFGWEHQLKYMTDEYHHPSPHQPAPGAGIYPGNRFGFGRMNDHFIATNSNVNGEIKDNISYASQRAFLFPVTIRDNIVMDNVFDEDKYIDVLYACSLHKDMLNMAKGDMTIINENNSNLSGGQRARVALARAVYNNKVHHNSKISSGLGVSDVHIYDDVLSALDSLVANHIWTHVMGPSGLLKDCTRIIVSHDVKMMQAADAVVVMDNGAVAGIGSYAVLKKDGMFDSLMVEEEDCGLDILPTIEESESKENYDDSHVDGFDDCRYDPDAEGEIDILPLPFSVTVESSASTPNRSRTGSIAMGMNTHTRSRVNSIHTPNASSNPNANANTLANTPAFLATPSVNTMNMCMGDVTPMLRLTSPAVIDDFSLDCNGGTATDEDVHVNPVPIERTLSCFDDIVALDPAEEDVSVFSVRDLGKLTAAINSSNVATVKAALRMIVLPAPNPDVDDSPMVNENVDSVEATTDSKVTLDVYYDYFVHNRRALVAVLVLLIIAPTVLKVTADKYLAYWAGILPANQSQISFTQTYIALCVSCILFSLLRAILMLLYSLYAAANAHNKMLKGILNTFIAFFQTTPQGAIINRCSRDQAILDEWLPITMLDTIQLFATLLSSFVMMVYTIPYLIVVLALLCIPFLYLSKKFINTSREIKRLDSLTRTPYLSLLSLTLNGVSIVKALKYQAICHQLFVSLLDCNSRIYIGYQCVSRWLALRLDILMILLNLSTTLTCYVLRNYLFAGNVALILVYMNGLATLLQWCCRQFLFVLEMMTSAQRQRAYGMLDDEYLIHNTHKTYFVDESAQEIDVTEYLFRDVYEATGGLHEAKIKINDDGRKGGPIVKHVVVDASKHVDQDADNSIMYVVPWIHLIKDLDLDLSSLSPPPPKSTSLLTPSSRNPCASLTNPNTTPNIEDIGKIDTLDQVFKNNSDVADMIANQISIRIQSLTQQKQEAVFTNGPDNANAELISAIGDTITTLSRALSLLQPIPHPQYEAIMSNLDTFSQPSASINVLFESSPIDAFAVSLCAMFSTTHTSTIMVPRASSKRWPTHGDVFFQNIVMTYKPSLPPVLHNLKFQAQRQTKFALVGRTGAGKSTILGVLLWLFRPWFGRTIIDGIDTRYVPLQTLRRSIACVPQTPILFSGTIRYNLDPRGTIGNTNPQKLWDALDKVGLTPKINSMGGLDVMLQDGGLNLSLGEKQLLCMARAIVADKQVLLIDEATANCDPVSDRLIQRAMKTAFSNCTMLVIAHRLQTIIDSNIVVVMDAGKVIEIGPPQQLISMGGVFANMYHTQKKKD